MGVPNATGDVWVAGVVDKVLFLFCTHPAVEVTSKYVIMLTMGSEGREHGNCC